MFNKSLIEDKIDKISLQFIERSPFTSANKPLFPQGFRLQRHSIPQVIQANAALDKIWGIGPDGKPGPTRPYTSDEIRWIRNERAMCRVDFLYWATRYGFIKDIQDRKIRFSPNLPQSI